MPIMTVPHCWNYLPMKGKCCAQPAAVNQNEHALHHWQTTSAEHLFCSPGDYSKKLGCHHMLLTSKFRSTIIFKPNPPKQVNPADLQQFDISLPLPMKSFPIQAKATSFKQANIFPLARYASEEQGRARMDGWIFAMTSPLERGGFREFRQSCAHVAGL
ncbi:uncharacterized protein [Dermacentor andersoni]|uniref:uncharacterized protein n=1 Tax=Dermacentor andersoni TaxID=34620 RepID=UPI003B3A9BEE